MESRLFQFVGGLRGTWAVERQSTVLGAPLPAAPMLDVIPPAAGVRPMNTGPEAAWTLRGFKSNERYTTRSEHERLAASQAPLNRAEAVCGALIPIRKNAQWWALSQDQRREIFEERSHHIGASMRYLPAIARSLHHSRDLGEPFDFLTWFEFSPEHSAAFDELAALLRATEEWKYVDREIDIRVRRVNGG